VKDPYEVGRAYADAITSGDIDGVLSLLTDRVVWHQPGDNQFSGTMIGKDAVAEMFESMMKASHGTFRVTDAMVHAPNGQLVALHTRFYAHRPDARVDTYSIDLFKVNGDLIEEVWLFTDDIEAEDRFWG
jgi:ketosteroid isomerase-like protein